MRSRFDQQLIELNEALTTMGAYCENAIALAAKALLEDDDTLAAEAIGIDRKIDEMERDIETMCFRLLLQQQPVARDLRIISAALKMITDMERIGDQAADIAEIVTASHLKPDDTKRLVQMAREAIRMVTDSVESFVRRDLALARSVVGYDGVVDDLFDGVKQELMQIIRDGDETAEYVLDLLMIAKYFERIGDHAVNIAEWVEYSVTGVHVGGDV